MLTKFLLETTFDRIASADRCGGCSSTDSTDSDNTGGEEEQQVPGTRRRLPRRSQDHRDSSRRRGDAGTAAQDNEEWVHGSDTIVPDCPDWLRVFLSGSHRSLQDGRGEASSQGGVATGLGIQGSGDQGDSSGRSSAVIDQRGVEQEMELIRAKEKLVRLELELERLRVENRPRSSASGAELSLREEVLSFSRLMKGVLTQMPSSELLVPSWFDGVENVFQTYEVPERLRGSLIRPYFTERMRALVNRLPVGEASEYGAVKERVLLELKMSPAEYRRLFLNATRAERESWTQFVTRVESCVEYYARSRSVESLEDLLALIVSDRVRDSMPVDMQEERYEGAAEQMNGHQEHRWQGAYDVQSVEDRENALPDLNFHLIGRSCVAIAISKVSCLDCP
ncbi:hypothetical protein ISCGN_016600 [Ixodes scapularis]